MGRGWPETDRESENEKSIFATGLLARPDECGDRWEWKWYATSRLPRSGRVVCVWFKLSRPSSSPCPPPDTSELRLLKARPLKSASHLYATPT
jgi:hypothetical protein